MKARAILFDLGNTLVSYYRAYEFEPVLEECVSGMCEVLRQEGFDFDSEKTFQRAKRFNFERDDLEVYPLPARLQEIFSLDDKAISRYESNLAKAFLIPIFETAVLDEEAVPLLKELKENGYLTGLISNTPWGSPSYLWLQELNRHGLTQYLDDVVFCVDAGRRKPHPDIFHYALERLEVSAQDTIFVGDDPKWDIYGARQAGISPILLNPAEGVVTDDESIRRLSELVERV